MPVTQLDKGNAFRALHRGPRAFIIANAWDAGSARILAGLGYSAIATSSWASANVYGKRDHTITREQSLAHARAIGGATDLPVSADLESGFGATPKEVAETYRQAAAAGLVGATLEDAPPRPNKDKPLFDIDEATERVAAAVEATRKLGFPFLLTARRGIPSRQYQSRRRDPAPAGLREGGRRRADGARLAGPQLGEGGVLRDRQALQLHGWHPWQIVLRRGARSGRRTPHQPRHLPLSCRDGRARRGGAGDEKQRNFCVR
jgi:hypothetical protein